MVGASTSPDPAAGTAEDAVLEDLLAVVRANPHGGASLVLFALAKTLSTDSGQYLFLLNKLRDIDGHHRRLAYRLMEVMARSANTGPRWEQTLASMEQLIRSAP